MFFFSTSVKRLGWRLKVKISSSSKTRRVFINWEDRAGGNCEEVVRLQDVFSISDLFCLKC